MAKTAALCSVASLCFAAVLLIPLAHAAGPSPDEVYAGFVQPPVDCKPHTRWWWMDNALRKEDIAWQLDQMQEQGIGGVEQITMEPVYQKGNHEYLTPQYFDLLKYAVEQARDRGMEFSLNFGGPGWIWGGEWVPKEDQSKVMLASMMRLDGPSTYSGPLPENAAPNPNDLPRSTPVIAKEDRLLHVVAARRDEGRLRADTLVDVSALVQDRAITWNVPEGRWQLMAFWITQRDNANAVDHLNAGAMKRYCEKLGQQYCAAIGDYFGTTVDSLFGDSFEVPIYRNGLYWTDGLFAEFEKAKGYNLVPWLPALWWEVGDLSPKVRYDVNEFLHAQSMRSFFGTFLDWCDRHNVRGRIQPYGFVNDIIKGAGRSHIPEMEVTAGEKDAVPWFDTRIGPRTYVASGAHLYDRPVVTAEAFTYIHWEAYRATLQELKAATDAFLVSGANKLYNHGYIASPERGIIPTRGFYPAIRISHENIWWRYYNQLAKYTARCCWLLRQGRYVADVAVYSPLANQWTMSVLNARKWTREFDWGPLGQLLMANGYGFDLINDDILQNNCSVAEDANGAQLNAGAMTYRVLVLPDIGALPLETFRKIEAFARGGGAVIALERVPEASTGMKQHEQDDAEVRRISADLFGNPGGRDDTGMQQHGKGRTFFMKTVMRRDDPLDWRSAPLDPFLKTLRRCVAPDVDIDLVRAGLRNNEGLTQIHRRTDSADVYFLANLQDEPIDWTVGFRVTETQPFRLDPHTGSCTPMSEYARDGEYTRMRLSMQPFESRFIMFDHSAVTKQPHVEQSDFVEIAEASVEGFTAVAAHNGAHTYVFTDGSETRQGSVVVENLPAPYQIGGPWKVVFEDGPTVEWPRLMSWTDDDQLRHFSGTARYSTSFELTREFLSSCTQLSLSLGSVGNVAEIRLNGKPVGTHWMAGQVFILSTAARSGTNTLEVNVTNTLINRVSGLDAFPEVAAELQPFFGTGVNTSTPDADKLRGFEPLPPSGLLGPVLIRPFRLVRITIKDTQR